MIRDKGFISKRTGFIKNNTKLLSGRHFASERYMGRIVGFHFFCL